MGPSGLQAGPMGARPALLLLLLLLLLLPPPSAPEPAGSGAHSSRRLPGGVTCSAPAAIEHADIQVKSFQEGSRERYSCFSGFKRKAGTSSLTECVYNQTTGTARWTRPTLKCIRDPSLTRTQPPSNFSAVPSGVTPKPPGPSPSGQDASSSSRASSMEAPEPAPGPGSGLKPSGLPPAGPAEGGQQAAFPSVDAPTHEAAHNTKVLQTVPFIMVCGLVVSGLYYLRLRRRSRPQGAEMENSEGLPMTTVAHSTEEDPGNQPPDLGDPTYPPTPL